MVLAATFYKYAGKVLWHMSASKWLTACEISDAAGVPKDKTVFCLRVLKKKGIIEYKDKRTRNYDVRHLWRIRGRRIK